MLLSAQVQTFRGALPGTVNYVEGQVSIDGNPLNTRQDGNTQVQPNQSLMTANGKAEMLLSPGVFVRAGNNSDIRMVSNGLANPTIEVIHGNAMIEVDQKATDAQIDVLEHGATASILKFGLYRFNGDQGTIQVVDGKLRVSVNGKTKELGQGHEVALNDPKLKTVGFDRKAAAQDDLYRWSSVRSAYLAQANEVTAQSAYMGYGPYWGNGWYWNPYFAAWSWLPGDGFFYSPFGYPFFSPGYVVYARYGGYGFRGGFAGRPGVNLAARGGFAGGGFHGGFAGGGGFHGGGRR
jgi:hypothetical protein